MLYIAFTFCVTVTSQLLLTTSRLYTFAVVQT